MAEASVEVPAGLVARVRESAVLLYAAAAEGLHLALRAQGGHDEPGDEVLLQRERLALLDALLAQMGWWRSGPAARGGEGGPAPPGGGAGPGARGRGSGPAPPGGCASPAATLELSAPADLLHDALYGAVIDAGERLALACGESWRTDGGLEAVRAAAAEVIALDRLLGEVRAAGPRG